MAIVVDATSTSGTTMTPASSLSWTHTVGSNANGLVVATITAAGTITGVTYDGVSMTLGASNIGGGFNVYHYYLANPPTGAKTIIATASASVDLTGGAVSLLGVSPTSPINTSAGNAGGSSGSPATNSVTTTAGGCMLIDGVLNNNNAETAGASQTEHFVAIDSGNGRRGYGSYKAVAAAGSYSMSWTFSSGFWSQCVIAIAPAASTNQFFQLF